MTAKRREPAAETHKWEAEALRYAMAAATPGASDLAIDRTVPEPFSSRRNAADPTLNGTRAARASRVLHFWRNGAGMRGVVPLARRSPSCARRTREAASRGARVPVPAFSASPSLGESGSRGAERFTQRPGVWQRPFNRRGRASMSAAALTRRRRSARPSRCGVRSPRPRARGARGRRPDSRRPPKSSAHQAGAARHRE